MPTIVSVTVVCLLSSSMVSGQAPAQAAAESASAAGLTPAELFPGAAFDPGVPPIDEAIGIRPGARPLRPAEVLGYFERLAASPRARLIEYARSHEGRPLVVLAISDEATIGRLDAFRAEHRQRLDPRGRSASDDASALRDAKAVAWMAYGIHGDELSSTDAAAALAYWLVAGDDDRARATRRDLVVLIDPVENPDGRERFLAQTTAFADVVPNPDAADLSHTAVWPWGRGNHYLFDLNRDWFTQVHPESRRVREIAAWLPQLMVDSHEMDAESTYLFGPSRDPFNPHQPSHARTWMQRFTADQARALDARDRGWAYYTREWNEEFFPGYGSSWASYHGAVGILYEMSETTGTLVRQPTGVVRTFSDAVKHQVTSSLANLETLRANRAEILAGQVAARRDAVRKGSEGAVRAWILGPGRDPVRTDALAATLRAQGIEMLRLVSPVRAAGLREARSGDSVAVDLAPGSWMVPMDQPSAPLARAILDPHVPMAASFYRDEREHLERGEDSRLYDATAWSLPLLRGVDAWWAGSRPAGEWQVEEPGEPQPSVGRADPLFGYVFEGVSGRSVGALADVLQRGLTAHVAEKPFRVGGRTFSTGAVLVRREGSPTDLPAQIEAVASRWKIQVEAVSTSLAEDGPDLGGSHFPQLVAPRVGVFTGSPVSPAAYGWLWHLLDRETGLRFSGLELIRSSTVDLARYNVLVFPSVFGGGQQYRHLLGTEGVDRLRRWIEAGGTAIGIGSGAEFLADPLLELTAARLRRQALDRFPPAVLGISAEEAAAAGRFRAVGAQAPREAPDGDDRDSSDRRSTEAARRRPPAPVIKRESPYDIAPVIGPGARPFVEGHPQGTPAPAAPVSLDEWLRPLLPPGKERPDKEDRERADERLRRFGPKGAMLRVELDPKAWLTWGAPAEMAALAFASDTLVAEPPVDVPARYAALERLHLGGLLWPEGAARIARTAYVTREAVRRGQVILFADDPGFRGWTLDTRRLLLNALLYGPGLGTEWSAPW